MKKYQSVESRESKAKSQPKAGSRAFCPRLSTLGSRPAFTLVELLTVIAVIGILAAILLPTLAAVRIHAQKTQAQLQISEIVNAIQKYYSDYSRMPLSSAEQKAAEDPAQQAAGIAGNFTFGGMFNTPNPSGPYAVGTLVNGAPLTNNDVIAILMDLTNYPGTDIPTVNTNGQKNPQQTIYLNAKMNGWSPAQGGLPPAGVGNDLAYLDPWHNPYVITMDLNDDNRCMDAFYRLQKVSQNGGNATGFNGLVNPVDANGRGDHFAYHGNVMVWSAGPDGKINPNLPANADANKDNVLGWQ